MHLHVVEQWRHMHLPVEEQWRHMHMHMHMHMHVEEQWRQLACSSWHELDRTGPDRPEPD